MAATAKQIDHLISGLVDTDGTRLSGGKIYTYDVGTTNNKTTWVDRDKNSSAPNPIILDTDGNMLGANGPIYGDGLYTFKVTDSADSVIDTYDVDATVFEGAVVISGVSSVETLSGDHSSDLATMVSNVGATDTTVYVDVDNTVTDNVTVPANITLIWLHGAVATISNTKTLTLNGPLQAGLTTLFAGAGDVRLGSAIRVGFPEWWGARADGATASLTAIDKIMVSTEHIQFQSGTYLYDGQMTGIRETNDIVLEGVGAFETVINFTDNTVFSGISHTLAGTGLRMRNMRIKGPGMTSGTNVHGYYESGGANKYNVEFENCLFSDWSGNGFTSEGNYNSTFRNVGARNCGGNGFEFLGDQSITFINSGVWNQNIGGYSWHFGNGRPFLQGLNCENPKHGIRFGTPAGYTSPLGNAHGSKKCYPTIVGLNIESLGATAIIGSNGDATSRGIVFEANSNFASATGLVIYVDTITAESGIYWESMGDAGVMFESVAWLVKNAGSLASNDQRYNGAAISANGSLLMHSAEDQSGNINATMAPAIATLRTDSSLLVSNFAHKAPAFINNNIKTLEDQFDPSFSKISVGRTDGVVTIISPSGGVEGQQVTILAAHSVAVTNAGNIVLSASPYNMTPTDTLTLIWDDGTSKWVEISRTVNI